MEQQEKLTVLLIEPACYPKTVEIDPGLEPLQKAVGGWIEAVYPWEDKAAIIINEEGKLDQLPLNRALRTEEGEIYDITAGNMLIVGLGEEDFSSLTKDQLSICASVIFLSVLSCSVFLCEGFSSTGFSCTGVSCIGFSRTGISCTGISCTG